MKDLKALFDGITGSEELKAKFKDALKNNTLADFLKENDCDAKVEEVLGVLAQAVQANREEAMSPDEMETVAGGSAISEMLIAHMNNSPNYSAPYNYSNHILFNPATVMLTPEEQENILRLVLGS